MKMRPAISAVGGTRKAAAAFLIAAALFAAGQAAFAQGSEVTLVNRDRDVVERKKDGSFVARPMFDRKLAFLAYAVRDADSGDWITGVSQVRGGEKRLSDGWEYSFEYPSRSDHPALEPENVYVLFLMAAETSPGDPTQFHVVVPVHQPTGLWDRVIGAFDPARWAKAFARWIVEGVHGTLCGAVEEASGTNPSKCGGR